MRFLTIVILVSVVLAGCADRIVTDSDYEVPRFDRPSVEHISPRNTSVNVPTDAPVSIWFDMLMDEERSEEHTSELQSRGHLVCRLLLEKKNTSMNNTR